MAPLVVKRAIDTLVERRSTEGLPGVVAVLAGLAVIRAASGAGRKYQASRLTWLVGNDLRQRLYQHLQRLSFEFHQRIGTGQLMSRASSDIAAIENALAMGPFLIQSVFVALAGATIAFVLQPLLAAALVGTLALTTSGLVLASRSMVRGSAAVRAAAGRYAQFASETIAARAVVRGHGLEGHCRREAARVIGETREAGERLSGIRARFFGVAIALPASGMLVVVGLGGYLALHGAMTTGSLFAFMQYLWMLVGPIMTVATALSVFPEALAGAARLAEVLRAPVEIVERPGAVPLPPGRGAVRFDRVTFGYPGCDPVLHDFSLEIAGGESVAVVGPAGCGKSTVARLLLRFHDPQEGRVELDGVPVTDLRLSELRRGVSVVFQDTVVFSETVRANIALGAPQASADEIRRAAELAHADEFVRALPDGYDTVLTERGNGLSGGQRQRLAIARAVLRDPRVLVLDDAVSAIDAETAEAIARGLAEVMHDRTTIVIAHRPATTAIVDRVVLMDGGRVVAEGRHDELLGLPAYRAALAIDGAGSVA